MAVVYQDFLVRCRMRGLDGEAISLAAFRRRLGVARAGFDGADVAPDEADGRWEEAQGVAATLPDEVQGLFLLLARAALAGEPCPGDEALARAIGSRSPGRAKRLLAYVETRGTIVCRMDYRGNRIVALPALELRDRARRPQGAVARRSPARRTRRPTADPACRGCSRPSRPADGLRWPDRVIPWGRADRGRSRFAPVGPALCCRSRSRGSGGLTQARRARDRG